MTNRLTYDQVIALLPAYALGALELDEMLAVDDMIHRYPALAERLSEIEEATAYLAHGAATAPLSPAIKDRVLARVDDDLAKLASDSATAVPESQPQARSSVSMSHPKKSTGWLGRIVNVLGLNGWAVATAATVVALLTTLYFSQQTRLSNLVFQKSVVQLQQENQTLLTKVDTLQTENTRLHDDNEALLQAASQVEVDKAALMNRIQQLASDYQTVEAELARIDAERTALQASITEIQTDNDALHVLIADLEHDNEDLSHRASSMLSTLNQHQDRLAFVADANRVIVVPGTDAAPHASATFYADGEVDTGLMVLRDLAPLAEGETYQLWLIPDGEDPISAGELMVTSEQPAWTEFLVPDSAQDFVFIGVSREDSGWEPAHGPSSDQIVLLGSSIS